MTATDTPVNNGVNVEALLGAREALIEAPERRSSSGGRHVSGRTAPTAARRSRVSSVSVRSKATAPVTFLTPTIRRSSPLRTTARPPWNTSWWAWPAA